MYRWVILMNERETQNQALLELFNNAVKSYDGILALASPTGLNDSEKTVMELAIKVAAAGGYIVDYAERIANIYLVSATVAGKKPDKHKARRLVSAAKRIDVLANKIRDAGTRENIISNTDYQGMARNFVKELINNGDGLRHFYARARTLFKEIVDLSQKLMGEASDNLALIGMLPRRRFIEEFTESLPDNSELSESINDNKRSEADQ